MSKCIDLVSLDRRATMYQAVVRSEVGGEDTHSSNLVGRPKQKKKQVLAFVEIKVQASRRHAGHKVDGCKEKYFVGLGGT